MLKKLRQQQKGFTIIEVLIVLAIAGLILLIVFLAVPALQRNSRNTQRKNDIAAILGGVSEYTNNHSGTMPPAWCNNGGNNNNGFDATAACSGNQTIVKLGTYAATDIAYTVHATATGTTNNTTTGTVQIHTYEKCDPTGNGNGTATGASSRSVVALYTIESGTGAGVHQCQES